MPDHDRPLAGSGRRDAARMGRLIAEMEMGPRLALCSSATRARETLELLLPQFDDCPVATTKSLYLCPPGGILDQINELSNGPERVLVVGHNPGLEQIVAGLTGCRVAMPPAALTAVSCHCASWSDLKLGTPAELLGAWTP